MFDFETRYESALNKFFFIVRNLFLEYFALYCSELIEGIF